MSYHLARQDDLEEGRSPYYRPAGKSRGLLGSLFSSRHLGLKLVGALAFLSLLGLYNFHHQPLLTVSSSNKKPLNIIISSADADIGEVDYWIHQLLSRLDRPVDVKVQGLHELRVVDDSVIIGFNQLKEWKSLVQKSGFRNVGLLRVGDEYGNDTMTSYDPYAYVLRPYYFPHLNTPATSQTPHHSHRPSTQKPIMWIPNGYSKGVGPRRSDTLLPYSDRSELCYFEGSPRDNEQPGSREKMRVGLAHWEALQKEMSVEKEDLVSCVVHWTGGFMHGRPPLEYSSRLGRAKYALCPDGNSAETIRLYEALENNAIPIVVYQPWMEGAFGGQTPSDYPFIVLDSWEDIGSKLRDLSAEAASKGRARQNATRKWWNRVQKRLEQQATRIVDDAFFNKYDYPL